MYCNILHRVLGDKRSSDPRRDQEQVPSDGRSAAKIPVFDAKTALELHLIDGAVEVLSTHDTNVVANFI